MSSNYQTICQTLLSKLPERTKKVIIKRFGLKEPWKKETLETVGKNYGICRERVRQIENDGLRKIEKSLKEPGIAGPYQEILKNIKAFLVKKGNVAKEDEIAMEFAKKSSAHHNYAFFLLTLSNIFKKYPENPNFYSFWSAKQQSTALAKKLTGLLIKEFENKKQTYTLKDLVSIYQKRFSAQAGKPLNFQAFSTYLSVSKDILKGPGNNKFGLKCWPEINPKGVKDKACLVLEKEQKPLHFIKIADLVKDLNLKLEMEKNHLKGVHPQTVHNELIRDSRFVLVGRGIYALKKWGYASGDVKDILLNIFKEKKGPLSKKEIIKSALKQRLVKESTISFNLNNKAYFEKDSQGKYRIRES